MSDKFEPPKINLSDLFGPVSKKTVPKAEIIKEKSEIEKPFEIKMDDLSSKIAPFEISIEKPIELSMYKSINEPVEKPIELSIHKSVEKTIELSMEQPINFSINSQPVQSAPILKNAESSANTLFQTPGLKVAFGSYEIPICELLVIEAFRAGKKCQQIKTIKNDTNVYGDILVVKYHVALKPENLFSLALSGRIIFLVLEASSKESCEKMLSLFVTSSENSICIKEFSSLTKSMIFYKNGHTPPEIITDFKF